MFIKNKLPPLHDLVYTHMQSTLDGKTKTPYAYTHFFHIDIRDSELETVYSPIYIYSTDFVEKIKFSG